VFAAANSLTTPFPHLFPLTCNSVQKYRGLQIKNESLLFAQLCWVAKAPFNPNSSASENKIIISFYVLF
jgi:hypothetical protein